MSSPVIVATSFEFHLWIPQNSSIIHSDNTGNDGKETWETLKIASHQAWKLSKINIHTNQASGIMHGVVLFFFGDSPRSIIILTLWRSWWPRWKELAGLDTEDATWRCSAGVECCIKNGSSQMLGVLPSQTQGLKCCTNKNKDCTNRNEIVVHPGGPNCHFARCPSPWAFGLLRTPQWSLAA